MTDVVICHLLTKVIHAKVKPSIPKGQVVSLSRV